MRSGTRMLIAVLVLGVVLTRPATGQRLVSDFPRVAEVAVPRIGPLRVGGPPGMMKAQHMACARSLWWGASVWESYLPIVPPDRVVAGERAPNKRLKLTARVD